MTQEAIGRADYVLGADFDELKKRVAEAETLIKASGQKIEQEYEKAGSRAGDLFGKAISVGLKGVATVAAGAFAIASRGLIELDNLQADFRAETGATEQAARKAGDAILDMSRRNIQPMREIGAALAKVHTDLGLAGDEAAATTERFLRFARATKQDAAAAVVAFDDILDAWNLTAADADGLMDKLIVSHQKYGGSIDANQAALARLAPQLQGLNLTVDDGIGLLNLFASSGLDASAAQMSLNQAIQKLPKGESLTEFIARLSTIEDDGLRAAAAMEVFGTRGGAGLANAIRPGVSSLDAFKVSAQEAAGATDEAAAALDSAFGTRVQLMIKDFGGALVQAARDAGPLFTTLATLGTAAGALGLDKFGKRIVEALAEAGKKGGEALIDAIGTATGAAGTIIGNVFATRIENIIDPRKNTVLGRIVWAAGAKVGLIMGPVIAAGTWLSNALISAWSRSALAGPVRAVILAAAIQQGTLAGTAMGTAMAAAIPLALAAAAVALPLLVGKIIKDGLDQQQAGISAAVAELTQTGTVAGLERARAAILAGLDRMTFFGVPWEAFGGRAGLEAELAKVDAALADAKARTEMALKPDTQGALDAWASYGDAIANRAGDIAAAAERTASRVTISTRDMATAILGLRDDLVADSQASADAIFDPLIAKMELAATTAEASALRREIAEGKYTGAALREAQLRLANLDKELTVQQTTVASFGDATAQIAQEKAMIARIKASAEWRTGSEDQKAILRDLVAQHNRNIDQIVWKSGWGGKETQQQFIDGLKGFPKAGAAPVSDAKDRITSVLGALAKAASSYGSSTGDNYSNALRLSLGAATTAARNHAAVIGRILRQQSPAKEGPFSEGGGMEGWGKRAGELFASGLEASLTRVRTAATAMAEQTAVRLPSPTGSVLMPQAAGPTTSITHGPTINLSLQVHVDQPINSELDIDRLGERLADHIRTTLATQLSGR